MSKEKPRAEEYYLDIHRDSSWKGNQGGQRLGSKIQFFKKYLSTYLPIYLFIWLRWVLVAARGSSVFTVAHRTY